MISSIFWFMHLVRVFWRIGCGNMLSITILTGGGKVPDVSRDGICTTENKNDEYPIHVAESFGSKEKVFFLIK